MGENTRAMDASSGTEALLAKLEDAVDGIAEDLDIDVLRTGNVITLAFENGHRIIVNSQEAIREIWVAARSGGFHYRRDELTGQWFDTRSGEDLRIVLSRLIEIETGVASTLRM